MISIEVGSYEAKTKLPELLLDAQHSNRYTITLRGEAIAELVPSGSTQKSDISNAVKQMHAFLQSHPPLAGIDNKALVGEGRD